MLLNELDLWMRFYNYQLESRVQYLSFYITSVSVIGAVAAFIFSQPKNYASVFLNGLLLAFFLTLALVGLGTIEYLLETKATNIYVLAQIGKIREHLRNKYQLGELIPKGIVQNQRKTLIPIFKYVSLQEDLAIFLFAGVVTVGFLLVCNGFSLYSVIIVYTIIVFLMKIYIFFVIRRSENSLEKISITREGKTKILAFSNTERSKGDER